MDALLNSRNKLWLLFLLLPALLQAAPEPRIIVRILSIKAPAKISLGFFSGSANWVNADVIVGSAVLELGDLKPGDVYEIPVSTPPKDNASFSLNDKAFDDSSGFHLNFRTLYFPTSEPRDYGVYGLRASNYLLWDKASAYEKIESFKVGTSHFKYTLESGTEVRIEFKRLY